MTVAVAFDCVMFLHKISLVIVFVTTVNVLSVLPALLAQCCDVSYIFSSTISLNRTKMCNAQRERGI